MENKHEKFDSHGVCGNIDKIKISDISGNSNSKILVVGDLHGSWGEINSLINKKNPEIILQCGDFGYWPHYHKSKKFMGNGKPWDQYGLKNKDTKIYWCDGNHENHDELDKLVEIHGIKPIEVPGMKNIFYCPRGTVITLPDNRNVLFMGGGISIDKEYRIPHNSWWPQELINQKDLDNLPDVHIDIVISHTIPKSFFEKAGIKYFEIEKYKDPSCVALDIVFVKYNPTYWYAGHFHKWITFKQNNCNIEILNMSPYGRWWNNLQ